MAEQRTAWQETIPEKDVNKLVFIDESGVNVNMTRRYGRACHKDRVVDEAPFSTPKSTTILSSIRLDGSAIFTTYSGGTTGERFLSYLRDVLLPTLKEGDIIVMDNLRTHHIAEVRTLVEGSGMELLYLPPYSPDFNPIEMMWSKIKSILRKLKHRTVETLVDAIPKAFQTVSPKDCLGWFRKAGYC